MYLKLKLFKNTSSIRDKLVHNICSNNNHRQLINYQYNLPTHKIHLPQNLITSQLLPQKSWGASIILNFPYMNYLFGGKPQQPQTQHINYVQTNPPMQYSGPPIQIESLQKKSQNKCRELSELITNLEREAADLFKKAKESKGSSKEMYKNRCTQILKKKKLYEQQLKTYMGQQTMLYQVSFTRQNIQNTIEMGHTMKQTVEAQKALMQHVDIDQLEDIRDQIEEMKFQSDYTNQLLNRNYDVGMDDIDLDAEMQQIDNDFYQQVMKNPKKAVNIENQQMQMGSLQKDSLKF